MAKTPLLGTDAVLSAAFLEAAGDGAVGYRLTGIDNDPKLMGSKYPTLVAEYKKKFGEDPIGGFHANGYDCALAIMLAVEKVAKTDADGTTYIGRKALRDALMATKDLDGDDRQADLRPVWRLRHVQLRRVRIHVPATRPASRSAPTRSASTRPEAASARLARQGAIAEWVRQATPVDWFLLGLRILVVAVLAVGVLSGLLHPRYGRAEWFSFLSFGLTIGAIYALIALGYTMVYGILRMVNFAHGDVFMFGAYAACFTLIACNRNGLLLSYPWLALLLALAASIAVSAALAILAERIAYRPFRGGRLLAPLISTLRPLLRAGIFRAGHVRGAEQGLPHRRRGRRHCRIRQPRNATLAAYRRCRGVRGHDRADADRHAHQDRHRHACGGRGQGTRPR